MAGLHVHDAVSRCCRRPVISLVRVIILFWSLSKTHGLINTACDLVSGQCGQQCRQSICQALVDFAESTYSADGPSNGSWATQSVWGNAAAQRCSDMVHLPLMVPPAYCSWHGVMCCWDDMVSANLCKARHSVFALELPVNGLTGNITSPAFLQAIKQLHDCGMTQLTLDGNALYGSFSEDWGQMKNLTALTMGESSWLQTSARLRHDLC